MVQANGAFSEKPLVAVTAGRVDSHLQKYVDAVERSGGEPWVLTPDAGVTPSEVVRRAGALVLTGGEDIEPRQYGEQPSSDIDYMPFDSARDEMELSITRAALDDDLPIYGICRGMQLLNVAMGGRLVQHLEDHSGTELEDNEWEASYHHIYISPGSKLAAVVGSGGFVRVNSLHHQGVREAQKSPHLLASAYSLEDGLIEALESPRHRWVIAVQFHPERRMEVPPHFDRLFQSLVERAEERLAAAL
ncbi:MAG: gamma-glutamyl-gamma-aminobutyrate hydrolase family protein [Dehalococcoidia bacterium]|nr:gamma-glutamyl-gamma-aminobutyrate hydrolase family protein [Dehalococcoidia bacterium]